MKWYDYAACFWFADQISTGILHMNIFLLTLGVISYILYEGYRKGDEDE